MTECNFSRDEIGTRKRYREAVKQLKISLDSGRRAWQGFEVPDIESVQGTDLLRLLRKEFEKVLNEKELATQKPTLWEKGKRIVESMFMATSLFAKNFLTITQNAQSVFRSCLILWLTRTRCLY